MKILTIVLTFLVACSAFAKLVNVDLFKNNKKNNKKEETCDHLYNLKDDNNTYNLDELKQKYITTDNKELKEEILSKLCNELKTDFETDSKGRKEKYTKTINSSKELNKPTEDFVAEHIDLDSHVNVKSITINKEISPRSSKCYKGNDTFNQACNPFNGNSVIDQKLFLSLSKVPIFRGPQILEIQSENDCDACMGDAFKAQTGEDGEAFKKAKEKVENELVKDLKIKRAMPSILSLSGIMEKSFGMQAMYGKLIDEEFKNKSIDEKKRFENSMFCLESGRIKEEIKSSCATSFVNPEEAIELFQKGFRELGIKADNLDLALFELKRKVSSKENVSCPENGDRSIIDYKINDYLQMREIEKEKGNQSSTKNFYMALDEVFSDDANILDICRNVLEKKKNKDGDFLKDANGKIIYSEYIPKEAKPEIFLRKAIQEASLKTSEEEKILYGEKFSNFFPAKNGSSTRKKFELEIMEVSKFDPNLSTMLSDWRSFCLVRKDSVGNPDNNLPPTPSLKAARGLEPLDISDKDVRSKKIEQISAFAKSSCNKQYKRIADSMCQNNNINGGGYTAYDVFGSAKDLLVDKLKKAKAETNLQKQEKTFGDIMALGALKCSLNKHDQSLDDPAIIAKNPLRVQSNELTTPSSFGLMTVRDMLKKDVLVDGVDNRPEVRGFFNDGGDKNDEKYCSENTKETKRQLLEQNLYGTEVSDDVTMNYFAENFDSFADEYPELTGKVVNSGMLGRKRTALFSDKLTDMNSILKSSDSNSPSDQITSSSSFEKNLLDPISNMQTTQDAKSIANELNQKANKMMNTLANGPTDGDVNAGSDMLAAWKTEKQAYLDKIAELEKSKSDELQKLKDSGATPGKTDAIKKLEEELASLEKEKESVVQQDKNITEMQKLSNEKKKLETQIAAAKNLTKKIDVPEAKNGGSRKIASSSIGGFSPSPGVKNFNEMAVSDIVPTSGVGGSIITQDPSSAYLSLVNLEEKIQSGDVEIGYIKVDGKPAFIKVPGYTNYIDVNQLSEMIESSNGKLDFLKKYLNMDEIVKLQEDRDKSGKKEIMIASLDDANSSVSLGDMRAAIEFSKVQLACIKNQQEKAKKHIKELSRIDDSFQQLECE